MPLTEIAVRKAKGRAKSYKLADGAGLYVLVRPDSSRYWRIDYRFDGRRKTLALGVYPSVSLTDARQRRDAARKQLAAKVDPAIQRRMDKVAASVASQNTFRRVADEWLAKRKREGRASATLNKITWLLSLA